MTEEQQAFIPPAPAVPAPLQKAGAMKAGGGLSAIIPQTLEETFRYAQMVFTSGMFPDWIRKKPIDQQATCVTAIIVKSLEVGLPPMSGLANIMEVNNRFTIWGDGAKALVLNSGQCEIFREYEQGEFGKDDYKWVCEIKLYNAELVRREFSWADAKIAKLTGKPGPWMVSPKRMVQMRARGFCMRDAAPHVLQGLAIHEEVRDIPTTEMKQANTDFLDAGLPPTEEKILLEQAERAANPPLVMNNPVVSEIMTTADANNNENFGKVNVVTDEPVCDTCKGYGVHPADDEQLCPDCKGETVTTNEEGTTNEQTSGTTAGPSD